MRRVLMAAVCVVLAGCTTTPPDGQLDCPTDESWIGVADFGQNAIGSETPEAAIESAMAQYQDRFGGDLVFVADNRGSLVIDGNEVVIVYATPTLAGSWLVRETTGCEQYTM
jgi:hypothetical protein